MRLTMALAGDPFTIGSPFAALSASNMFWLVLLCLVPSVVGAILYLRLAGNRTCLKCSAEPTPYDLLDASERIEDVQVRIARARTGATDGDAKAILTALSKIEAERKDLYEPEHNEIMIKIIMNVENREGMTGDSANTMSNMYQSKRRKQYERFVTWEMAHLGDRTAQQIALEGVCRERRESFDEAGLYEEKIEEAYAELAESASVLEDGNAINGYYNAPVAPNGHNLRRPNTHHGIAQRLVNAYNAQDDPDAPFPIVRDDRAGTWH